MSALVIVALAVGYLATSVASYVGNVAFWYRYRTTHHREGQCEQRCRCRHLVAREDRDLRSREAAREDAERISTWLAAVWPLALVMYVAWGALELTCEGVARGIVRPVRAAARRGMEHDLARARFDAEARAEEARAEREAREAERRRGAEAADRAALARALGRHGGDLPVRVTPAFTAPEAARSLVDAVDGQVTVAMTACERAAFLAELANAAREAARRGWTS